MSAVIAVFLLLAVILSWGPIGFIVLAVLIGWIIFMCALQSDVVKENEKKKQDNRKAIKNGEIYGFSPTKEICRDFSNYVVFIDESHRKVMFSNIMLNTNKTYFFDELVECSILEDGTTVNSVNVSGAIVGGLVGGDAGMILGGKKSNPVTLSLSVRIITSNIQDSLHAIPIITSETKRNSDDYKQKMEFPQEIYATMTSIIKSGQRQTYSRSMRW